MTLLPRSLEFKSTWLEVNTDFLRDLNTLLAVLIRLWISRSSVPLRDAAQVLEVALDLHPVGTHLDPGGGAVVTAAAG